MKFNFFKEEFFEKYKDCEEMEKKPNRPYACTTLVNCMGVTFAVPLRSHIRHEYAVFTDKEKTKGLDLTKAVVVNDVAKYIDTETKVYIKNEEHKALKGKEDFLAKKLENYIKQYKKALETQEKSIVTDKENPEVSKEDPWKKKLENDKIKGLSLGE